MKNYIKKAMTFAEYIKLLDDLLTQGKTTGVEQTQDRIYFSKLNRYRMKRLEKTVVINDQLKETIRHVRRPLIWLVITEGWCGDGAQNVPAIEKMAAQNPLIQTRYLLRDENLDLMDRYLTNGGRAIPLLICIDGETFVELGKWGTRPRAIQEYFLQLKATGMEKSEILENVQRRYNADHEQSIQADFTEMLGACVKKSLAAKA